VPARIAGDFREARQKPGLLLSGLSLARRSADIEDMSRGAANLQLVGSLLLVGAVITLGLHALEAPESLYRWLYHHLLSGLDVPEDPSRGTVDAISYVSLIGGLLEVAAGLALLAVDRVRQP
jgi:hypothetical protein